jgi:predicted RNA-binding Zn ribbon-like protein
MMRVDRFAPGRQPSGRTPAPGRLGLVQAFANSFWDLDGGGADAWPDAPAYARWLRHRGFDGGGAPPTEADRERAITLREALRALARRHHDDPGPPPPDAPELALLDATARRAAATLRLRFGGAQGTRHEPAADGPDAALALVLGVVAEAMADGTWSRLKACPGPHCGWVFYDGSRNRSRQWCSMQICGNRVKGREFRARRRAHSGETGSGRART